MPEIGDHLDYLKMSQDELVERVGHVARAALKEYGLADATFHEIHDSSIALIGVAKLRVNPTRGSESFLLSIHCRLPYWGVNATRSSIESYLHWLLYLHAESEFVVQEPLRNRSGDLITEVPIVEAGSAPIYCTLHRWVEGEDLLDKGRGYSERTGAIMAKLHDHASTWNQPDEFDRPEYTSDDLFAALEVLRMANREGRIAVTDFESLEKVARQVDTYLDDREKERST